MKIKMIFVSIFGLMLNNSIANAKAFVTPSKIDLDVEFLNSLTDEQREYLESQLSVVKSSSEIKESDWEYIDMDAEEMNLSESLPTSNTHDGDEPL